MDFMSKTPIPTGKREIVEISLNFIIYKNK